MNNINRKKQWVGVIGAAAMCLLFMVNVAGVAGHLVVGRGSPAIGIPLLLVFGFAMVWFGYLMVAKAKRIARSS